MATAKKLEKFLKDQYDMCVGDRTLEKLRQEVVKSTKKKITVSGRSYKTGRWKTVNIFPEKEGIYFMHVKVE